MNHVARLDQDHVADRMRLLRPPDAPVAVLAVEMLSTYGRLSPRRGGLARVFGRRRRRPARKRSG